MAAKGRRERTGDYKKKTEVVTIRLDPQLKYLAELAARRQRRPLSSFIEWAVEQSLAQVHPAYDAANDFEAATLKDVANTLWDVDEPDRFAKLALRYPDLLDHEEQRRWKLIRECGLLWRGSHSGPEGEWVWKIEESKLIWERLREHWDVFCNVARGEMEQSALPTWVKSKPEPAPDFDDEIPF